MRRIVIGILSVLTVVVLFLVLCTYRARTYEKVVLVRFGRVIPPAEQARIAYGWYLCWPTDKVVRVDKRLHLHSTGLDQVGTASQEPISVQVFAAWKIVDEKLFYERFSGVDASAEALLDSKVRGKVLDVMGQHALSEFFQGEHAGATTQAGQEQAKTSATATSAIEQAVTKEVSDEMKSVGIEVAEVGFSRMAFTPQVANSIYDRMTSERQIKASQYQSEGQGEANRRRSQGESQAAIITSTAKAQAEKIRGDGDAQALEILAKVQASPEQRSFYQFWRELDLLKNSIGKGTYLILRADQPLSAQWFTGANAGESIPHPAK